MLYCITNVDGCEFLIVIKIESFGLTVVQSGLNFRLKPLEAVMTISTPAGDECDSVTCLLFWSADTHICKVPTHP